MRGPLAMGWLVGEPVAELYRTQHTKVTPVLSQSVRAVSQVQCRQFHSEPTLPRYTPHTGPMVVRDMGAMTGNMGMIAR